MPELPEVETIARGLARHLAGATFVAVESVRADYVLAPPPSAAAHLTGRRVVAVARHGKRISVRLDPPAELLIHLGMSGRVTVDPADAPLAPHTHLRVRLSPSGAELRVRDPRRFGSVWIQAPGAAPAAVPAHRARHAALPRPLGPDALALGRDDFRRLLARPRALKALLLDQQAVAGLGNIYVDEILWASRLHPRRRADRVPPDRIPKMHRHLRRILSAAVRAGGSTLRDYRDADGTAGSFRARHRVYGHEGEPCPRCRATIRRLTVAGRSTFLCPRCQRAPKTPKRS